VESLIYISTDFKYCVQCMPSWSRVAVKRTGWSSELCTLCVVKWCCCWCRNAGNQRSNTQLLVSMSTSSVCITIQDQRLFSWWLWVKPNYPWSYILPCHAVLARYAVVVCPSVGLSVRRRYCVKTVKRRITQTTTHDSPRTLVFWYQSGVIPNVGAKCRWNRIK